MKAATKTKKAVAEKMLNVLLGKGVSFMCVLVAKESFTGVRFPSEEGIFTSLKGQSKKRAIDPHQLQNFRFRKNFQINKPAET